jgi:hypothetical protein
MNSYRTLGEFVGVVLRVPKKDCVNFKFAPAHEFSPEGATEPVKVPDHWKHGQVVNEEVGREPWEKKTVMDRHFYGIEARDLGRRIVATVVVREKVVEDKRKFVFVDITKTPGVKPALEMKLVLGFPQVAGDIYVGKITVLRFTPHGLRAVPDEQDVVELNPEARASFRAAK